MINRLIAAALYYITFLFAYLLHCIPHSPDVLTAIKQMKKDIRHTRRKSLSLKVHLT